MPQEVNPMVMSADGADPKSPMTMDRPSWVTERPPIGTPVGSDPVAVAEPEPIAEPSQESEPEAPADVPEPVAAVVEAEAETVHAVEPETAPKSAKVKAGDDGPKSPAASKP
jgi:hypothetical protein